MSTERSALENIYVSLTSTTQPTPAKAKGTLWKEREGDRARAGEWEGWL